jgi:hypothetical protein
MKNISDTAKKRPLKNVLKVLALAIMMMMSATLSTHADDMRGRGRAGPSQRAYRGRGQYGRVDRDWQYHERRAWQPGYVYAPPVVYPPPVVYAPPVYQQPGINFIVPLNIR